MNPRPSLLVILKEEFISSHCVLSLFVSALSSFNYAQQSHMISKRCVSFPLSHSEVAPRSVPFFSRKKCSISHRKVDTYISQHSTLLRQSFAYTHNIFTADPPQVDFVCAFSMPYAGTQCRGSSFVVPFETFRAGLRYLSHAKRYAQSTITFLILNCALREPSFRFLRQFPIGI